MLPQEIECQRCNWLNTAYEWQPIETAPKDGTCILICRPYFLPPMYKINTCQWEEGVWLSNGCVDDYLTFPDATHWMPLPEPPTEEA